MSVKRGAIEREGRGEGKREKEWKRNRRRQKPFRIGKALRVPWRTAILFCLELEHRMCEN